MTVLNNCSFRGGGGGCGCSVHVVVIYLLICTYSSFVVSWSVTTTTTTTTSSPNRRRCAFYSYNCRLSSVATNTASEENWNDGNVQTNRNNKNKKDILRLTNDKITTVPVMMMNRRSAMMMATATTTAGTTWTQLPLSVEAADATTSDATLDIPTAIKDPSTSNKNQIPTIPFWTLEGDVRMPIMALNTAGLTLEGTERALELAVQNGITHVDFHPARERDGVAKYLERLEVTGVGTTKRSDLFLTTKINTAPKGISPVDAANRVRDQIEEDLAILNVKNVDMLMLRDSPDAAVIQSQWLAFEEALQKGQTRAIGVINFCEFSLKSVLQTAKIKPAVNYYLTHVGMGVDPKGLRSFGEARGIRTFAYGALGEPGPNKELLSDSPVVTHIAAAHNVSTAAVALRWIIQSGAAVSVRPTKEFGLGTATCSAEKSASSCNEGLHERATTFQWELTNSEMKELTALTSPNDNPTLFSSAGCPDAFGMKDMIKYMKSI